MLQGSQPSYVSYVHTTYSYRFHGSTTLPRRAMLGTKTRYVRMEGSPAVATLYLTLPLSPPCISYACILLYNKGGGGRRYRSGVFRCAFGFRKGVAAGSILVSFFAHEGGPPECFPPCVSVALSFESSGNVIPAGVWSRTCANCCSCAGLLHILYFLKPNFLFSIYVCMCMYVLYLK